MCGGSPTALSDTNSKCKVTCCIKSLFNGVTTNCVIVKDGPGRYRMQYTQIV